MSEFLKFIDNLAKDFPIHVEIRYKINIIKTLSVLMIEQLM